MTLIIIAVNIAVAFWLVINPNQIVDYAFHALHPVAVDLFASLFMHVNVLHLLGNMIFLAAVAPAVESGTGPLRFLLLYLISGLAGLGGHWLLALALGVASPVVGASGAIAGCVA